MKALNIEQEVKETEKFSNLQPTPGKISKKASLIESKVEVEIKERPVKRTVLAAAKRDEPVKLKERQLDVVKEEKSIKVKEVKEEPKEPVIKVSEDTIDFDKMKELDEIKKMYNEKPVQRPLSGHYAKKAVSARPNTAFNRRGSAVKTKAIPKTSRPFTALNRRDNNVININFNFYGLGQEQVLPQVKKTLIMLNENFFKGKTEKKSAKPTIKDLVKKSNPGSRLCFKNIIRSNTFSAKKVSISDFEG